LLTDDGQILASSLDPVVSGNFKKDQPVVMAMRTLQEKQGIMFGYGDIAPRAKV